MIERANLSKKKIWIFGEIRSIEPVPLLANIFSRLAYDWETKPFINTVLFIEHSAVVVDELIDEKLGIHIKSTKRTLYQRILLRLKRDFMPRT